MIASEPSLGKNEAPPTGKRERKKQLTRENLVDAAFTLFDAKGYDATTVDEIADAAGVSARTFFRYFGSKEEVALTFQAEQKDVTLTAIANRPREEPVFTAARRGIVTVTRAYERGELGFDHFRYACLLRMLDESPTLLAASLQNAQTLLRETAEIVAGRTGADPDTDIGPHVQASCIVSTFQAAMVVVRNGGMSYTVLSDALDEAFASLEDATG
ncbi:TetR family transcriptional regulator [Actinomadura flavalba]|uniref:TetR family transcriptional regulator n=1 Tax=Actinomadura flavalba TaxID=1120938 RepID=UPI0003707199|nr:TetR family transcriptional regulator [Actinomadura flavalba]